MTAAHQPAHADADTRGLGLSIHVPPSAIQQRRLVYHASAWPSPATFGLGFGPCSSYHGGPQRVLHRVSGLVAPACSPTWCPYVEFRVHGNMDREGIRALKMSPTSAAARGLFHAFICLYCSGSISASCGFKADAPSPRTYPSWSAALPRDPFLLALSCNQDVCPCARQAQSAVGKACGPCQDRIALEEEFGVELARCR